jgi:hypothetical protein
MKRFGIIILLWIIIINNSLAQENFKKGYIIDNSGEKVIGFLLNVPDKELTCSIRFKKSIDSDKVASYSPIEIKGFVFENGRRFESFYIPEYSKYTPNEKDSIKVFLKVIIGGKVNLFELRKNYFKKRYFINKNNELIYELTKPSKNIVTDIGKLQAEKNEYIGILNYFFSDCQKMFNKTNNIRLNQKSLRDVIIEYNQCIDPGKKAYNYYPVIKKSIKISYSFLVAKISDEIKKSFRVSLFREKFNSDRHKNLSTEYGLSFIKFDIDNKHELFIFNLIPFQLSNYSSGKNINLFYECWNES